ncbi:phosphoinositide-dependent kinase 1 isoform X3 [Arctopsyche grandis]|uniref:phosphoinositide-dependent kinase 1 isoform X3 n=1 Tax=Arctopsyche grandis TaxID=121162 RepID=UPI00406D6B7D
MKVKQLNGHPLSPLRGTTVQTNATTMSPAAAVGGAPSEGAQPPVAPTVRPTPPPSSLAAEHASLNAPHPDNLSSKRTAKDFIFGKVIGEGCFSTVYLAKYIHSGKEYAIKVCDKSHIIREKKSEYIKREKEILNMLFDCSHGFVKLFCTFQDSERLYFVLSYAKNGELNPHINKVGSFDLECTRFYAAELVLALEQLQQRGIIHRDLKPENILLDENMHILVTDFGSAKILRPPPLEGDNRIPDENDGGEDRLRQRRMSFVGTAQYVSPELLTDKCVSRASDLWALGCIIYQMISALPPFRSNSEYVIFQKIINLDFKFPEGFDSQARDLVQKLLVLDPTKRLGAMDKGPTYDSIRNHPFFRGVNWDTIREQRPPPIYPYLPGKAAEESFRSQYRVPDHLEPGLGDVQLSRLLELDLADTAPVSPIPAGILNMSTEEFKREIEKQRENNKWHRFVEGNLILKYGLVDKRKGLFARRRMLLLTTGPRLYYVDPANMVVKGEIPWSEKLRVEPKSFRIFFVHTPNRTYYLEDPDSFALDWCKAIEDVRLSTYPQNT